MHTITQTINSTLSYLKEERCFFDLETTGLCKQRDFIYCIGVISCKQSEIIKIQWLIDSLEEEKLLLDTFLTFIKNFKVIISYNGKSFDVPFLKERMGQYNLESDYLESFPHLDLKKFNLFTVLLNEKKLNRKLLEEKIGFKRSLTIEGRELIKLYTLYRTSLSHSHRHLLLGHNTEELLSCLSLYEVYYLLSQISYDQIQTFHLTEQEAQFELLLPFLPSTVCHLTLPNFELYWETSSTKLTLSIFPQLLYLRKYLLPAKDYVYIPSQNQIMHKSVAQFLPKSLKEKVSKEHCYIEKKGSYIQLPQEKPGLEDIWYNEQKTPFLAYHQELSQEFLWKYIKQLIPSRL